MEAKELRIGNIVSYNNKAIKVNNILDFAINMTFHSISGDRDEEILIEEIEPIPLTEEILLKIGFEKSFNVGCSEKDHNVYYWSGKISLTIDLELSSGNYNYDSTPVDGAEPLKYVHQLQNLYHALTGEELDFKL